MKKMVLLFFLCLSFVGLLALAGKATEPSDSLVSVVGLDEYGNPVRQGMGVAVSKDGGVLTSASIVSNCRSAVAKTADGALHILRRTAQRDSFQDTILLQFDAEDSKFAPAETAPGFQLPEKRNLELAGFHEFEVDNRGEFSARCEDDISPVV